MNQDALDILATDLDGSDLKVLMKLLGWLDYENLIQISQTQVAESLRMHRQNVNRSMKRLVKLGVLLEGPRISRSRTYRLNPYFGWKGSARKHQEALRDRMKARGLTVVEGLQPSDMPETAAGSGIPD